MSGRQRIWGGTMTVPPGCDIPQWLIDDERRHARAEVRTMLGRGGADPTAAERQALRIVPDPAAYAALEAEHRATSLGLPPRTAVDDFLDDDGAEL